MEFLNEYMLQVVLGICLCIGYVLKNLIPTDKVNRFIPAILSVLGVVLSAWISKWNITPDVILSGLVSGLASTGLHQLFKQFIENKNN